MRYLRYLKLPFLVCTVFLVAFWFLAPWERLGAYMMSEMKLAAAKNGVYITFSGLETKGVIMPSYTLTDFKVEAPVVMANLSNIKITLLPFSSLTSGGVACALDFGKGDITIFPKNKLDVKDGSLKLINSASDLKLANVWLEGDLEMSGQLTYNKTEGSITDNALLFKVPENLRAMLASPLLEKYVESVSPVEWRIRQDASPKP